MFPHSLGLLPSASLVSLPNTNIAFSLYEPCHSSVPDLPRGKVNPIAIILSAAMILKLSLNLVEEGTAVEEVVRKILDSDIIIAVLGSENSTSEVGDAIAKAVKEFLA